MSGKLLYAPRNFDLNSELLLTHPTLLETDLA